METAWRINNRGVIRDHGGIVMFKALVSAGRMALIYRYRRVLLRALLCFSIFAVIELIFQKWQLLIQQLSLTTQTTILISYTICQLFLLVMVILNFSRSDVMARKDNTASKTKPCVDKEKQFDLPTDLSPCQHNYSSKIDRLLDIEQFPELESPRESVQSKGDGK